MNLLYLHAFPLDFLRYDVIINGSIFMSELLFGLCFRFCFKQNPQVFVLNKCVLWLQSRSCFRAIFSFLTLSSVFITRGLISLIFLSPPDVIYNLFCGSKAEVVLRQFLVTWPCRACLRTRDLILPNFITPWSCLQRVLWPQSRSCFTANFCYLTLKSVYWTIIKQAYLSIKPPPLHQTWLK